MRRRRGEGPEEHRKQAVELLLGYIELWTGGPASVAMGARRSYDEDGAAWFRCGSPRWRSAGSRSPCANRVSSSLKPHEQHERQHRGLQVASQSPRPGAKRGGEFKRTASAISQLRLFGTRCLARVTRVPTSQAANDSTHRTETNSRAGGQESGVSGEKTDPSQQLTLRGAAAT